MDYSLLSYFNSKLKLATYDGNFVCV